METQGHTIKDSKTRDVIQNGDSNNTLTRPVVECNDSYSSSNRQRTGYDVIVDLCTGCGLPIKDRHFLTLSTICRNWHLGCLVCTDCRLPLDRELTCYTGSDGRIYCRDDYFL